MLNIESVSFFTRQAYCLGSFQIYTSTGSAAQLLQLVRICYSAMQQRAYLRLQLSGCSLFAGRVSNLHFLVRSAQPLDFREVVPLYILADEIERGCSEYLASVAGLIERFSSEICEEESLQTGDVVAVQPLFEKIRPYWDHVGYFYKFRRSVFAAFHVQNARLFERASAFMLDAGGEAIHLLDGVDARGPTQRLQRGRILLLFAQSAEKHEKLSDLFGTLCSAR